MLRVITRLLCVITSERVLVRVLSVVSKRCECKRKKFYNKNTYVIVTALKLSRLGMRLTLYVPITRLMKYTCRRSRLVCTNATRVILWLTFSMPVTRIKSKKTCMNSTRLCQLRLELYHSSMHSQDRVNWIFIINLWMYNDITRKSPEKELITKGCIAMNTNLFFSLDWLYTPVP